MRKVFLLLFAFGLLPCLAQNISVSSFKSLDTDLTANTAGTMENDQNGETAALIKVVTTQTGFTFDGGALGIVKTKQTPGEIWVYIPRGSKKITIKHPQLGVLRDYFFPIAIESARTYEMVLIAGEVQTVVKQARTSQYVVFQLTPPDAVVELNGELLKTEGGIASKMMKFGTYNYRVQAPDYLLEAGSVTVDDPNNKKVVNISLKPNFAKVTINVDNNAEIWVNGEKKGEGSWSGNLGAGTYELEAKKEGHRSTTITQDFIVTSEPQIVKLQTPTPIYGEVDINSSPGMADIFIDGKKVGQTPQLISNIIVGHHSITIEKKGFKSVNKSIEIKEEEISIFNFSLKKEEMSQKKISVNKNLAKTNVQQEEIKNAIDVIKLKDPITAEPLAEELCKKYNDYPDVIVMVGEAFYQKADSTRGKRYFRKAIKEHPNYTPAYVAAGAWAEDRYNAYDEAMDWYDKAIRANPTDSSGYMRYARVLTKLRRPEEAAAKIKEITKYIPDFPVNKQIARIYSNLGQITEAVDFYALENMDNLDSKDLKDYATDLFLKHQYQESLDVAKYGFNKYPKLVPMSRLALYNCVELKDYKEAYKYGNYLFKDTEKHKEIWQDMYYMALACQGANQTREAIDWFRRCTQADDIAQRERNKSYRNIAKLYKELGDYDMASKTYDKLYELQKAENNISAQDINMHARLFMEQSTEVNGEEVFECYRKANRLYELLAEMSPDNAGLAYHAIMLNYQRMDPNFEQGLALAPAERLINLLKNKPNLGDTEKKLLADGYWTLCYYQSIAQPVNKALVKKYGQDILNLNPNDERPKHIFQTLKI